MTLIHKLTKTALCLGASFLIAGPASAQSIGLSGAFPTQAAVVVTNTGANSVTVPSWANWVEASYCGGGGAGGNGYSATTGAGGGGGGAGQAVSNWLAAVTPGSTLTVTIGAAGTYAAPASVTTISGGLTPFPVANFGQNGANGGVSVGGNGGNSGQNINGAWIANFGAAGGTGAAGSPVAGGALTQLASGIFAQMGGAGGGSTTFAGNLARSLAPSGNQTAGGTSGTGQGGGGGAGGASVFGDPGAGGNGSAGVAPNGGNAPVANTCAGGGGAGAGTTGGNGGNGSAGVAYLRFMP